MVLLSITFSSSCDWPKKQSAWKSEKQSDWIDIEHAPATNDAQRFAQRIVANGGHVWFGEHPPLASSDEIEPPPTLKQWESAATTVTGIHLWPKQERDLTELVHFESLDDLVLSGRFLSDESLVNLPVLKNLKTLFVGFSDLTGEGLRHLQPLPKLETLQIYFCKRLRGESLLHLRDFSGLRKLEIANGSPIDETTLTSIGTLAQLRELKIGNSSDPVNCKSVEPLLPLGNTLETLRLVGFHLSDNSFNGLANFTRLQELVMHSCQVNDSTAATIGKIKSLERLFLSGGEVTDEGLKHLRELTSLREMIIYGNGDHIQGQGLIHLSDLKALRSLHISIATENQHYLESLRKKLPDCQMP